MTTNHCVDDILKHFQGVLDSLALRQSTQTQAKADGAKLSLPVQSIRTKTTREFHVWDRVKESTKSPEHMRAEIRNLALVLVGPIKVEGPPPLPNPTQLAKSRSAHARSKATSSRLKSLEGYLNQNEKQQE